MKEFFMWAVLIVLVYYAGLLQGRARELEYSQYGYRRADERRERNPLLIPRKRKK